MFRKLFSDKRYWLIIAVCILMVISLFGSLGQYHFFVHADESTRVLVAQEMKISGNYIAPTINGEFYLKKPPLYNWILLITANISGSFSEFSMRIPSVLFLLLFGVLIYFSSKKYLGKYGAVVCAFMFITSGRVLFWESLFTIIDFGFSCIAFAAMMAIFHLYQKGRITAMFVVSYGLTAVAFLMKGLPAFAFLAFTLSSFLWSERKFRLLFTYKHFVGIASLLLILVPYYWVYSRFNTVDRAATTLWQESVMRTFFEQDALRSIKHLFCFPYEIFYHFLPWTFLIITLLRKDLRRRIADNPFVKFCFIVFVANLPVYWVSSDFYPKYILALVPLLLVVLLYFFQLAKDSNALTFRWIYYITCGIMFLSPLLFISIPFINGLWPSPYLIPKIIFLVVGSLILVWLQYSSRQNTLMLLVALLLMIRMAFNWFIWPIRVNDIAEMKTGALHIAEITRGNDLQYFQNSNLYHSTSFYITNARQKIVGIERGEMKTGTYYLVEPIQLDELKQTGCCFTTVDSVQVTKEGHRLKLIQKL